MSVDNLDEDTKNELALGFTYVEVADDENEGKDQVAYGKFIECTSKCQLLTMACTAFTCVFRYHCTFGVIPAWLVCP